MSFEQWTVACLCLAVAGFVIFALATGRVGISFSKPTRQDDPVGFWFAILMLLIVLSLAGRVLLQLSRGGRTTPMPFVIFGPLFLFYLIEALRTGEVRLINEQTFTRADRPTTYWTHVAIISVIGGFSLFAIARDLLR